MSGQVEELARQPYSVVISVSKGPLDFDHGVLLSSEFMTELRLNLDGLLERIWQVPSASY